jgi:hypothetical protein
MNEIALRSEVKLGFIDNNFEEFLGSVQKEVAPYIGLAFDETQTAEAKETVAKLNKYRKDVDGKRLTVKKEWMKPYDEFEQKVKQALVVIDNAIEPIKTQVTEAEGRRIEERKKEVAQIINDAIRTRPSFEFILSCNWFYDQRWENKTVKTSAIKTQAEEKANQIDADLSVISSDEYSVELMAEYRKHGSLVQTLIVRDRLVQQKKDAEAYQERMRAQREAMEKSRQELAQKKEEVVEEKAEVIDSKVEVAEQLMTVTFKATATQSSLAGLKQFCSQNGIVLERA